MNFLKYLEELKVNEKKITQSPNVKLMSSVKARKMYRQDNIKKAGFGTLDSPPKPRQIKIIANTTVS